MKLQEMADLPEQQQANSFRPGLLRIFNDREFLIQQYRDAVVWPRLYRFRKPELKGGLNFLA